MTGVEVITSDSLTGVTHGFLGRRGGVSDGVYSGLDMGRRSQGTNPHLEENQRRAIAAVLPNSTLCTLYQIHSAIAVQVDHPFDADRPQADALVTDRSGLLLGILTADCAPILLADVSAGVIGAAHAGWKGALGGVTDSVITVMERLGAQRDRIMAAVGPCIARSSYEVDEAFARRFEVADPANERFFAAGRSARFQFDLEAYVAHRLAHAGIKRIDALGLDTYADADRFFSYRRATHLGEADYGRQISLIGLA